MLASDELGTRRFEVGRWLCALVVARDDIYVATAFGPGTIRGLVDARLEVAALSGPPGAFELVPVYGGGRPVDWELVRYEVLA